jgi:hypothetical protein
MRVAEVCFETSLGRVTVTCFMYPRLRSAAGNLSPIISVIGTRAAYLPPVNSDAGLDCNYLPHRGSHAIPNKRFNYTGVRYCRQISQVVRLARSYLLK